MVKHSFVNVIMFIVYMQLLFSVVCKKNTLTKKHDTTKKNKPAGSLHGIAIDLDMKIMLFYKTHILENFSQISWVLEL